MNIAVCVKQIPDPAALYELDSENHWVIRPNDQVLDDTDRFGIEVGLQLAEESEGTVTLFSMGPSGSLQGIRQALAMGADKAVLIDDESLKGSDALTTARILSAAIAREGFDLVIAGMESTDGIHRNGPPDDVRDPRRPLSLIRAKGRRRGRYRQHRTPDRLWLRGRVRQPPRTARSHRWGR